MTAPEGREPVGACLLYNTGGEWTSDDDGPPPLDPAFASTYRVRLPVTEDDVQIVWSPAGDAVAVRIHGEYVAFIAAENLLGYSRSVNAVCDWAQPFDVLLFQRLFA